MEGSTSHEDRVYFSTVEAPESWVPRPWVNVRKARIGWWVGRRWCLTRAICERQINRKLGL
jgi:hypothetical protein